MSKQIVGGIYARKYEWQEEPTYEFFADFFAGPEETRQQLAAQELVFVCPMSIEIEELSPGQFRARQIESLRVKHAALRDTFVKESKAVEGRIQELLAITDERED